MRIEETLSQQYMYNMYMIIVAAFTIFHPSCTQSFMPSKSPKSYLSQVQYENGISTICC